MLTRRQFALAVGATEKWVDNASRILRRRFERTEADARWLGAVREVAQGFDMRLECAADLATQVLALDPASPPTEIASSGSGAVRIVVDVKRYHLRFGIALAAALLEGRRRPGRRPPRFPRGVRSRAAILLGAASRGVDVGRVRALAFATPARRLAPLGEGIHTMLCDLARAEIPHVLVGDGAAVARGAPPGQPLLEIRYWLRPGVARRLAMLLAEWGARLRGVSTEYPCITDEQAVTEFPVLALETRFGGIVLRQSDVADDSDMLDLGDVHTLVLRVPALVAAIRRKRLAAVPATSIPELEAAAVVMNRIDLRP
ncbi:MAG TPA: hypothetical protein VIC24_07740 [Gemmatimonadaceae bacterium]|jgi:hypothetical protein